jgi:RNA polymerase sigma-70 factor (sigma-E family)
MSRNDDEFVEFASANSARLLHAAYLLTGDRHDAEDAAQATLARTYAAWSRVRRRGAYAYARTTLVNLVTDQWRRPIRENATEVMPEPADYRDLADDVTRRHFLVETLAALTARERTVVVLRHYFDLSEAEVAAQLKVGIGTIKSTNARALAKLRVTVQHDTGILTEGGGAL